MDLGLEGRVALVTGASRGIGRGIALGLAAEGCDVSICARGEGDLRETASAIESEGVRALSVPMDITEPRAAGRFVESTVDRFGRLDVVVNNVGGNRRKPFEELGEADWDELLELNFRSHVRTSREALPHLKRDGGGAILFISSIFGREIGGEGLSLYNTTKSALISVCGVMAEELASEGVRVNCVAPGSIRFPGGSWDRRCREEPEQMDQFIERNLPRGRFGRVEEVADVVCFLASDRASLVTGSCIPVDGAQSDSLI